MANILITWVESPSNAILIFFGATVLFYVDERQDVSKGM